MSSGVAALLRSAGIDTRRLFHALARRSLAAAVAERGLKDLVGRLRAAVPDIADQFSRDLGIGNDAAFAELKRRGLHAFQTSLALDAIRRVGRSNVVVADIGDSSGNHGRYLQALAPSEGSLRVISVNLDPVAVDKIRRKGGEAILARAEDFDIGDQQPDVFLCFELLEHLTDPVRFLRKLALRFPDSLVVASVPYRRDSRFGGWHLRQPVDAFAPRLTAEETHIFELSPDDWSLLARFAGFGVMTRDIYLQYPRFSPWRLTMPMWRRMDFEGFCGFILAVDRTLHDRYVDW